MVALPRYQMTTYDWHHELTRTFHFCVNRASRTLVFKKKSGGMWVPLGSSAGLCCSSITTHAPGNHYWQRSKKQVLLRDISCIFPPNSLSVIIGPSGCGKTTLLNVLSGRITPSAGSIRVFDGGSTVWPSLRAFERDTRCECRFVSATDRFPINSNTAEMLYASVSLQRGSEWRIPRTQRRRRAQRVLRALKIEDSAHTTLCSITGESEASAGEKKRTSVALEIGSVAEGKLAILFCDEPTTSLDSHLALGLIHQLRLLVDKRIVSTVIFSCHQPSESMLRLVDRVIVMESASVVYQGPPSLAGPTLRHICAIPPGREIVSESDILGLVAASPLGVEQLEQATRQTEEHQRFAAELTKLMDTEPVTVDSQCCHSLWSRFCRFTWEVRVLTQLIFNTTLVRSRRTVWGLVLLFLFEGLTLGAIFRNAFDPVVGRTGGAEDMIKDLESNSFRSFETIATTENAFTNMLRRGVHDDNRQDPLEVLVARPGVWRWLHRTLQNSMRNFTLVDSYPDRWFLLQSEDPTWINDYNDLAEFLPSSSHPASLDVMANSDRDLPWEDLNVFTPRWIITQGATGIYVWDHILGKMDWEVLPQILPDPYGHSSQSIALIIWSQIVVSVIRPLGPLIRSTGLPTLLGSARRLAGVPASHSQTIEPPLLMGLSSARLSSEASPVTRTGTTAPSRQLFLQIQEEWTLFKNLKRFFEFIPLPWDVYSMIWQFVQDTIDSMSSCSALFFLSAACGFASLLHLMIHDSYRLPVNRDVMNEHYGSTAFYFAVNIATLPIQLLSAILITIPFFLLVGFHPSTHLPFIGVAMMVALAMFSVTEFICCCTRTLQQAMRVSPLFLLFLVLFSGYFIRTSDLNGFFHPYVSSLSPYRWGTGAFILLAMPAGHNTNRAPNDWLLGVNGVEARSVGVCSLALVLITIGFRLVGGVLFKFVHTKAGVV
eukprot:Protomagalhaensia_sp_Gyna_25__1331@NODE_166_length_4697_cov_16_379777_g129_i0_p1_GENE_NODE_166_length_4697_cov_16_379777_g129_i0NODE_166_length_4697_cov_16_379777_g129_i0_p1_ORF_typecomplete_len941_score110_73ABC2_membrane/PF01061_24/1_1e03ABC2_membrane/PF01061_24/3_3e18ABC_tran/PF00005_27/4_1e16AAA_15/PF13175_6/0_0097AAA_15/PF13175_6/0_15AAA_22/PF13401_6/1_4e05ABC2_membrane_3/PF12698_7/3_6e05AAA_21/PF13304_6/0_00029AAA_16/PF13191_6/0_0014RsgA_GTPase/PF03193_16/0_0019AAA_23/PF13476_6/0_0025AAA_1